MNEPKRTPPKPVTKKERIQKAARIQLMKERQDACPHADVDQVLTKAGWRCSDCGKLLGKTIMIQADAQYAKDRAEPHGVVIDQVNKWELMDNQEDFQDEEEA